MEYVIKDREPASLFRFFEEIAAIPRGSGNEEAITDYLLAFAERKGYWAKRDELLNVYIKKPGSPGCENLPPVVLQGHSDIVCEKNADTDFDFKTQGLRLKLDGDILRAEGTTLGADNGNAISIMLAILDRDDLVHPPIECLITSQEEIGLIGAAHIHPEYLDGRNMINLDMSGEGGILVSAAGGLLDDFILPVTYEAPAGEALSVKVRGLRGGHSGGDIDKGRMNANKVMGRILYRLGEELDYRIGSVHGGLKTNAIPREGDLTLLLAPGDVAKAKAIIATVEKEAAAEHATAEPGFHILVEPDSATRMLSADSTRAVADLLTLMPNGAREYSRDVPGLVVASLNLGLVEEREEGVAFCFAIRANTDTFMPYIDGELKTLARRFGMTRDLQTQFPAWTYVQDSHLRQVAVETYRALTGKDATVKAVHGGLEGGVVKGRIPDMDIIATGPDAGGAHTPEEWLDIASLARTCDYVAALLRALTEK